jgi:hypothetical protein
MSEFLAHKQAKSRPKVWSQKTQKTSWALPVNGRKRGCGQSSFRE